MQFVIGRSPECQLVINHACVSSRHASLYRDSSGSARLKDEGSANGTFLNQPGNEIQEAKVHDHDIVFFSLEYKVPGNLLLKKFLAWEATGGSARSAIAQGQVHRFSELTVTLGSDADNHVVLPYLDVWPRHATITPDGEKGLILRDLGGGCTVNGALIFGGATPLELNATVEIGGVTISTSFDPVSKVITIGTERRGFYLTAKQVSFAVPARRLLDHVSFSVMPGEFVGLLGPSGCGKTTLITCLCGSNRTNGIYYNGHSLARTGSGCANVIGYVPQDDVLHPELTVRETLFYSARLRLKARTSNRRIKAKIDEVCGMLGLWDGATGVDLRDTLVGSPERKTLSGGQKKRVNLALEMLTDPLVLLLDEPTSGLSSGDTRVVMDCLRRLADTSGIPIIITIHQPSPRVYRMFDHALYLKEGRLAWFGPAYPDSVRYFLPAGDDTAAADEIMEAIDTGDSEALQTRYQRGRYAQKFVEQREQLIGSLTQGGDLNIPKPVPALSLPGQTFWLLHRQLKRRGRDLASLAIQFGQAPLLGLMLGIAFRGDRLNSPLFLLSFIVIWFGANATARDLVSERVLFKRERRGGVSPGAVLLSKMIDHGLMLLVQSALLLWGTRILIQLDLNLPTGLAILWAGGLCGATVGLLISVLAKSEIAATATTPLVLIPLILFGGYLAPFDAMSKPVQAISQLMPSRWGYEAILQAEQLHHREPGSQSDERDGAKMLLEFSHRLGSASDADRTHRITLCLLVLTGEGVGLAVATWFLLLRVR